MSLRARLRAAAVAELDRVSAEVAAHAPCRDLRPSIGPPPSGQLPAVLERASSELRLGQPDIHQGERMASTFLYKVS